MIILAIVATVTFAAILIVLILFLDAHADLKNTQEDYAQREAAWRLQQNPERRYQSDIRMVTGMFDEKRVRQIMRERDET